MHLSFLKKKKKKWNEIVTMALPNSIPLFTIPKVFFYPPISAILLPQLPKIYTLYFSNAIAANYFFPSHFWQWHCHNCHKFFPLISAMALPQTNCNNFFPSYFGNAVATNPFHNFFFFFWEMICAHNFYNIFIKKF